MGAVVNPYSSTKDIQHPSHTAFFPLYRMGGVGAENRARPPTMPYTYKKRRVLSQARFCVEDVGHGDVG